MDGICLFVLMLYVPVCVNNFSVMSGCLVASTYFRRTEVSEVDMFLNGLLVSDLQLVAKQH